MSERSLSSTSFSKGSTRFNNSKSLSFGIATGKIHTIVRAVDFDVATMPSISIRAPAFHRVVPCFIQAASLLGRLVICISDVVLIRLKSKVP